MKRILILCACLSALALGACTSDSQLPNPTGEGSIRAVNAIPGSPEIRFLIEERVLGGTTYSQSSAPIAFDDFEYNFNFEIQIPGETEPTRIATEAYKVEVDREHTFVLTGDLANPNVTVWTTDEREWGANATAFEIRFAHLVESRSATLVDVYYDEAVPDPVVSNKVATLAYGEVSDAQDFEEGEYIITITAAGDVNDVLYTSAAATTTPQTAYLVMAFDGTANDVSPIVLTAVNSNGVARRLSDASASPTVRFVHAAYSLPTADVYDDDMLTNRVAAGLSHGEATGDLDVSGDPETYYWTPANSTATVLLENEYTTPAGVRVNLYAIGPVDQWILFPHAPDRASVSIYAKLNLFNSALDTSPIDVYLLPAGETIDDDSVPVLRAVLAPFPAPTAAIVAGSYELLFTASGERAALAPALPIDLANGDVVDVLVLDTADPNILEVRLLPPP
jgi:hypothetical protein